MSAWMLALGRADERLLHALIGRRRKPLDYLMIGLTRLGDAPSAVLIAAVILLLSQVGFDAPGREVVMSLALSFLLSQVAKRTIHRPRPQLPPGFNFLEDPPDRFSFPSGHATCALAIALPLAVALPLGWAMAVLVVGLAVGVSRSYLGVHYPGDVVAGWMLACTANLLLFALGG